MKEKLDLIEMGHRICKEREALKLTREQLADKMGVSADTIKHVEYGEQSLTLAHFKDLVNVLDVSSDYLLCIDDKHGNDAVEDSEKRSSMSNVNYMMERWDAHQCSKVEEIVRNIKDIYK